MEYVLDNFKCLRGFKSQCNMDVIFFFHLYLCYETFPQLHFHLVLVFYLSKKKKKSMWARKLTSSIELFLAALVDE